MKGKIRSYIVYKEVLKLTQQEVCDFLKEKDGNGIWYSPKQAAKEIGISVNAATRALKRLREQRFVRFRPGARMDSFVYSF